ncbi:hypothetical protein [Bradyrhizobium sp. JR3.5]
MKLPANPPQLFMEEVSARQSETGHCELYLVMDGKRVAYRGHPGTLDAGKWVSLDPDFEIVDEHPVDSMPVYEAGEVKLFSEPKGSKH